MEPITTTLSALNSSYTLLKAALGAKVSHEVQVALQDMMAKVTDARLAGADLAERIVNMQSELAEARSEVRRLQEQLSDRRNYRLQVVLNPGVVAYVYRREGKDDTTPAHMLCAACWSDGKKTMLQVFDGQLGRSGTCPVAKSHEIYVDEKLFPGEF